MTADTTSSNAIQATQLGAFDYIAKPINDDHLLVLIRRALEYRSLDREIRKLRTTPPPQPLSGFVGHSSAMQEVYKLIRSEEHTSELQSQSNLVCRLLLEKKKT